MTNGNCAVGATNTEAITGIKDRQDRQETLMDKIWAELKAVRNRPTWLVLWIIGGLLSLSTGLLIVLVKQGPIVAQAAAAANP